MNAQEQQVIESLFERIQQGAAQGGPRDPEAEALIQQKVQGFTSAPYYMAQTMVVQDHALQQAEQRIRALEQQVQGAGSFAGGSFAGPTQGYQPGPVPQYQQQAPQQSGGGMGGFLAGAGKMALGIGGGILVADAAMGLARGIFGGGGYGGFGGGGFGYGGDEGAFERGYEAGQQNDDRDDRDQGSAQQDSYDDNQQSGWDNQDDGGSGGGDWGGGDDSGSGDDSGGSW